MSESNRAQAAFEFVSYFALFLLVFVVGVAYITSTEVREIRQREDSLARELAFGMASEIHFAARAGGGYERMVIVPKRIGASEYAVYIKGGFLTLNWSRGEEVREVVAPLSTSSVATQTLAVVDGYIVVNASNGYVKLATRTLPTGDVVYVDQ
ncbi:MAG: hypothetical protein QXH27_00410 [Candidatus Micrarchaeia archaeon]